MNYVCWFSETSEDESGDTLDVDNAPEAAEQYAELHAMGGEEEVLVTTRSLSGAERRFRVAIETTYTAREIHK